MYVIKGLLCLLELFGSLEEKRIYYLYFSEFLVISEVYYLLLVKVSYTIIFNFKEKREM